MREIGEIIRKMVSEFPTIYNLVLITWEGGRMAKKVVLEFKLKVMMKLLLESLKMGIYYCMS